MTDHLPAVRKWCQSLGVLSAVNTSDEDAASKLAVYGPLLVQRFPYAAFTAESLEYVAARAVKGFPTYGELAQWLGEWWKDRRPPLAALAPPDIPPRRPDATDEERAYVTARVAEITAHLSASRAASASERPPAGACPLSPGVLDQINPLPNGRKRVTA
jgi:hypothetical protein